MALYRADAVLVQITGGSQSAGKANILMMGERPLHGYDDDQKMISRGAAAWRQHSIDGLLRCAMEF